MTTDASNQVEMPPASIQLVPFAFGAYRDDWFEPRDVDGEVDRVASALIDFGVRVMPWSTPMIDRGLDSVLNRLGDWARNSNDESTIIYWIGHGWSSIDSTALAHARSAGPATRDGISPSHLVKAIAEWDRRRNSVGTWLVVFIDVLHSGPFVRQLAAEISGRPRLIDSIFVLGVGDDGEVDFGHISSALRSSVSREFAATAQIRLLDLIGSLQRRIPDSTAISFGGSNALLRRVERLAAGRRLAGLRSDEPSHVDLLARESDVDMLADLLAASDTDSPLALALLGEWGAGKSSFMLQVHDRIERIAAASREVSGRCAFVRSVRQVHFNAWHYADAHLWPGLVSEVYRALAPAVSGDAPPERVEQQRQALQSDRTKHEQEAERLRRNREAVEVGDRAAGRYAGVLSPRRAVTAVRAALREELVDLRASSKILFQWLVLSYAGFVLGFYLLAKFGWVYGIVGFLLPTAGLIAMKAGGWIIALVRQMDDFDSRTRASLLDREQAARSEVARLDARLAEVDAVHALAQLLEHRKDAVDYERYRGLLSQVHRDLDELSAALQKARLQWTAAGSTGEPPLQRIILYIDDLDRCDPRQVVEVLAALHLLLALPLFVVVVAADPRWLVRSLRHHHRELFADQPEVLSDGSWRAVGPVDYLDKIFQIPFALRPMGDAGGSYLRELLADAPVSDRGPATEPIIDSPGESSPVRSEPADRSDPPPVAEPAADTSGADRLPRIDLRPAGLVMTAQERDFIPRLGRLLSTPRSAKKMLNLYRLIRIGIAEHDLDRFTGAGDQQGSYQVAAVLLALVVSAPATAGTVFAAVVAEPDDALDLVELVERRPDVAELGRFADLIRQIRSEDPLPLPVGACRTWSLAIARFSFHTYGLASTTIH